jgi:hypothetical protein
MGVIRHEKLRIQFGKAPADYTIYIETNPPFQNSFIQGKSILGNLLRANEKINYIIYRA